MTVDALPALLPGDCMMKGRQLIYLQRLDLLLRRQSMPPAPARSSTLSRVSAIGATLNRTMV
jgi:hypothetical protein